MNKQRVSIALTEHLHNQLRQHLVRSDRQEDLGFALYHPSSGAQRFTALISKPVLPEEGERQVHGTASFNSVFFERVLARAVAEKTGIAFLHSHPGAAGWQDMSEDDHKAEEGMAGAVLAATGLPLAGLTLSGRSAFWSGRLWSRDATGTLAPGACSNVRVVGKSLKLSTHPQRLPGELPDTLTRTISAWGDNLQRELASVRVGIVGLGSVGSIVAEMLARIGFGELVLIDHDRIQEINLDRTLHAYQETASVGELKVSLAARSATRSATLPTFSAIPVPHAIQTADAVKNALDCDILFSCVDRPWPRSILNQIAYSHLIPVIDGGIDISQLPNGGLRSADWGAFVVGPGRRCLECCGQYRSELVAAEQAGDLDDPRYIESLPADSPLRPRENVFVFSAALASLEMLRLIQVLEMPSGVTAPGEERYSYPASNTELAEGQCHPYCSFRDIIGWGDTAADPGMSA